MPRPLRLPVCLLASAAATGLLMSCGGPDRALVDALDDTGLTLYLPEFRGATPESVEVDAAGGAGADIVRVSYAKGGIYAFTLAIEPAPRGPLCRAIETERLSECDADDTTLRSSFEEQSVVAVVREEVVLVVRGLVTEADPGLAEEVIDALRAAPPASSRELADVGE